MRVTSDVRVTSDFYYIVGKKRRHLPLYIVWELENLVVSSTLMCYSSNKPS